MYSLPQATYTVPFSARFIQRQRGTWLPDYPYQDNPHRGWPYWDVPSDMPDFELPQEPHWYPYF